MDNFQQWIFKFSNTGQSSSIIEYVAIQHGSALSNIGKCIKPVCGETIHLKWDSSVIQCWKTVVRCWIVHITSVANIFSNIGKFNIPMWV